MPHYTNVHKFGNKKTRHFRQRRIKRLDLDGEVDTVDLIVMWSGDTEPTDEAINKRIASE